MMGTTSSSDAAPAELMGAEDRVEADLTAPIDLAFTSTARMEQDHTEDRFAALRAVRAFEAFVRGRR